MARTSPPPEAASPRSSSPLARGHSATAALLAQAEGLGARLIQAATEGHDAAVRQLLALGAPANVTDERGATPLMFAARNGDLGILQFLLSRGADPRLRDAQGQSVFEWAERSPETGKHVSCFSPIAAFRDTSRADAPARSHRRSRRRCGRSKPRWRGFRRRPPAVRQAQRRAGTALAQLRMLAEQLAG